MSSTTCSCLTQFNNITACSAACSCSQWWVASQASELDSILAVYQMCSARPRGHTRRCGRRWRWSSMRTSRLDSLPFTSQHSRTRYSTASCSWLLATRRELIAMLNFFTSNSTTAQILCTHRTYHTSSTRRCTRRSCGWCSVT